MQRQRIIIIIGIVLALLSVFMIKVYLDKQRQEAEEVARRKMEIEQQNQVPVLSAKEDIPAGTAIAPDSLEVRLVPKSYLQSHAVTSLDRVAGMVTIAPIPKGDQITLSKLAYRQAGGLAQTTPVGKRAITISVDGLSSLGGMIRPGDYVDVIAMVPIPVMGPDGKPTTQVAIVPAFQNVQVLAVGQDTGAVFRGATRYESDEQRESSPLITLALNPQEANLIAFLQEQGKIRLVMRSPADAKVEPAQPVGWDAFFQYVMPQQMLKPEKEEPSVSSYVEIIRGVNKEKVPIFK